MTEEYAAIRLPNGPDGDSNYVLGLGIDTTVLVVSGGMARGYQPLELGSDMKVI